MTTRTYRQHCSVARALDLIGERWTLLLVRDLLTGPKRYTELLDGLPGIGTNLLATRLKRLAELGLTDREVRPKNDTTSGKRPGAVYFLTSFGRELEETVVALARFGQGRLGERADNEFWRPIWSVLRMQANHASNGKPRVDETYEFRIDGEVFHAAVANGSVRARGEAAVDPDLVLETDGETFRELVSGKLTPREAMRSPKVRVTGSLESLERCRTLIGTDRV